MNSREILGISNKFKGGKNFNDYAALGNEYSSTFIREDLRQAIVALRSIPCIDRSLISVHEGQGHAPRSNSSRTSTVDYVCRAEDIAWRNRSWNAEFNRQGVDSGVKVEIGETQPTDGEQMWGETMRSETMGEDYFTVTNRRIDVAPDIRTSKNIDMSVISICFTLSGKDISENETVFKDSRTSLITSKSGHPQGYDVVREPPPLPPNSVLCSQSSRYETETTREQEHEAKHGNSAIQELFDIYARSLETHDSEESKRRSKMSGLRKSSPEILFEELLESITAGEFDTLQPNRNKTTKVSVSGNKETAKSGHRDLCPRSSSPVKIKEIETNDEIEISKNCSMKAFMLTGIPTIESEQKRNSAKEQNNNDVLCSDQSTERERNRGFREQSNSSQEPTKLSEIPSIGSSELSISSGFAKKTYSKREINKNKQTPEIISEEIVDSLEKIASGTFQSIFERQKMKKAQNESVFDPSTGYSLENESFSVQCNHAQVFCHPEAKVQSKISQETVYCTKNETPVPPLREKVPNVSYSKQDSLTYSFRKFPAGSKYSVPASEKFQVDSSDGTGDVKTGRDSSVAVPNSGNRIVSMHEFLRDSSVAVPNSGHRMESTHEFLSSQRVKRLQNKEEEKRLCEDLDEIVEDIRRQQLLSDGREIENNYCGQESEADLDLEIEFSRNLEACTASDVECPGIDRLVPEDLHSSPSLITDQSKKKKLKSPNKLEKLIAKRRLERQFHVLKSPEDDISTISTVTSKSGCISQLLQTQQWCSGQKSEIEPTWKSSEPTETKKTITVSDHDDLCSKSQNFQQRPCRSDEIFSRTSGVGNVTGVASTNREIEKEVKKRPEEPRVLSEEVTSQEVLLKIVSPKKEATGASKTIMKTDKPPFRDLRIHRVMRICDDVAVTPRNSQIESAYVTEQPKIENLHNSIPNSLKTSKETATESTGEHFLSSVSSKFENGDQRRVNSRRIEHVSGYPIDIRRQQTVGVLRVPDSSDHPVMNIKQVVDNVRNTLIDYFKPRKRSIRVTCEASECRSESSHGDKPEITVIRNAILDPVRSSTSPALPP